MHLHPYQKLFGAVLSYTRAAWPLVEAAYEPSGIPFTGHLILRYLARDDVDCASTSVIADYLRITSEAARLHAKRLCALDYIRACNTGTSPRCYEITEGGRAFAQKETRVGRAGAEELARALKAAGTVLSPARAEHAAEMLLRAAEELRVFRESDGGDEVRRIVQAVRARRL